MQRKGSEIGAEYERILKEAMKHPGLRKVAEYHENCRRIARQLDAVPSRRPRYITTTSDSCD